MAPVHVTRAYRITEKNADTLHYISGIAKKTFTANIGWVLVEDWNQSKRFIVIPYSSFKASYPKQELERMKIDE